LGRNLVSRPKFLHLSINADEVVLVESLAKRAKEGDAGAFEALMGVYRDPVLASCRRAGVSGEDPEEVACEILCAFCSGFPKWQARSTFHTWASRVAYNVVCRHISRNRRKTLGAVAEWDGDASTAAKLWPSRLADSPGEQQQVLREAIQELPPQEREITEMRMSGHPTEEIAAAKGIAPGTVRAALSHAYQKLRRALAE